MAWRPSLPLPPWVGYRFKDLPSDLSAATVTCVLTVPQGLAYATIAGLPPVMGLYAAAFPTIVGSLLRSSSHVLAGPTNALSLLVGAAVATGLGGDPASIALTLALMVGVIQIIAGGLRLGAVVDYISGPVVLGYITGAGVLIGIGQLHNITDTSGTPGRLVATVQGWLSTIDDASLLSVGITVGTIAVLWGSRRIGRAIDRQIPSAVIAMGLALLVNLIFKLENHGLKVISDLAPIPEGIPSIRIPSLDNVAQLAPLAVACTVLSLVESSAVARSIAAKTGQRLDASTEFVGQGFANVVAGLTGGYPTSGSLSRSIVNERSGGRTRLAGILSGVMMLGVLLVLGSILDHTPIASLAGLLLVVAWDLVDGPRIVRTLRTSRSDALAFIVTVVATWTLSLDTAIYCGVGVSVVLFLRRARVLVVWEMFRDETGQWQDCVPGHRLPQGRLPHIQILQAEGPLFFGAAGDLTSAVDHAVLNPWTHAVIVRLRRAHGMDFTIATAIAQSARQAQAHGKALLLCGIDQSMAQILERSGATLAFPPEHLVYTLDRRFESLQLACDRAQAFVAHHTET